MSEDDVEKRKKLDFFNILHTREVMKEMNGFLLVILSSLYSTEATSRPLLDHFE
jgi:hypothetical protein